MSKQYTIQRTRTQAHLPETLCYLAYHILRYSIINMVKFGNTCSIERAFFYARTSIQSTDTLH